MMRLLCDENIVGIEALADFYQLRRAAGRGLVAADLDGAEALWVRSVTPVDRALVAGSRLRFVGTATAGTEHVDSAALRELGIAFAAAPGANANAVVEYVLAALAELQAPWEALEGGARLGIVGYGAVGRRLARAADALGWRVGVHDPWVAARGGAAAAGARFMALPELLRSTVISLHCSLHARAPWPSRHLIGAGQLAALHGEQWLINASRGAVVDNAALLARLRAADPPQVVLDVWEGEPDVDPQLLLCPSLRLATPHVAGYSWDSKWQATRMLLRAMGEAGLPVPETFPPTPPAPALQPVAAGSAPEIARALLRQRYCIAGDDRALRALGRVSGAAQRRAGFDRLRRDYPQRRELRGSRAPAGAAAAQDRRVYRGLGLLERETGFEPATSTLARLRSTN